MEKQLIQDVKELIEHVEKTHRYSMSRIYGAYNQAFGTEETPQACASCLIRKVNALKKWLTEQESLAKAQAETAQTKTAPAKKRKQRTKKSN